MIKTLGESASFKTRHRSFCKHRWTLSSKGSCIDELVEIGDSYRCLKTYSLDIYKHLFFSMSCMSVELG